MIKLRIVSPTYLRNHIYQELKKLNTQNSAEPLYVWSARAPEYNAVVLSKAYWEEVKQLLDKNE